MTYNVLVCGIG